VAEEPASELTAKNYSLREELAQNRGIQSDTGESCGVEMAEGEEPGSNLLHVSPRSTAYYRDPRRIHDLEGPGQARSNLRPNSAKQRKVTSKQLELAPPVRVQADRDANPAFHLSGSWLPDSTPRAVRLVVSVHDLEMFFQNLIVDGGAFSGRSRGDEGCRRHCFRRQLSRQCYLKRLRTRNQNANLDSSLNRNSTGI
jgi:hypothetical protein